MAGLFGGGGAKVEATNHVSALTPPNQTNPAIQNAAAQARLAAQAAAGRASTVATSASGDTSAALVTKKTLLGTA